MLALNRLTDHELVHLNSFAQQSLKKIVATEISWEEARESSNVAKNLQEVNKIVAEKRSSVTSVTGVFAIGIWMKINEIYIEILPELTTNFYIQDGDRDKSWQW